MLGGDDDRVEVVRTVLRVIGERHLGLPVGTQVRDDTFLADLGQPSGQPVGRGDRQRHELGGLVGGVTEHQALVTGTGLVVGVVLVTVVGAVLVGGVDAVADLLGLLADGDVDATG